MTSKNLKSAIWLILAVSATALAAGRAAWWRGRWRWWRRWRTRPPPTTCRCRRSWSVRLGRSPAATCGSDACRRWCRPRVPRRPAMRSTGLLLGPEGAQVAGAVLQRRSTAIGVRRLGRQPHGRREAEGRQPDPGRAGSHEHERLFDGDYEWHLARLQRDQAGAEQARPANPPTGTWPRDIEERRRTRHSGRRRAGVVGGA